MHSMPGAVRQQVSISLNAACARDLELYLAEAHVEPLDALSVAAVLHYRRRLCMALACQIEDTVDARGRGVERSNSPVRPKHSLCSNAGGKSAPGGCT